MSRIDPASITPLIFTAVEVSRSSFCHNEADLKDYTVPAMDVDIFEARAMFETNFFAVVIMCQTFLPLLIKSKGTIVQIGSVAGVGLISFGWVDANV